MTDVVEYRLNHARNLGATLALDTTKVDFVDEILKATRGRGVDVVVETTSSKEGYLGSTRIARGDATVVLLGVASGSLASLNILDIVNKELCIKGNYRYANEFANAVGLASSGTIDLKRLITHRFDYADSLAAFNLARNLSDGVIKAVINFRP
jgi:L-iditol 2-dehydrogenase